MPWGDQTELGKSPVTILGEAMYWKYNALQIQLERETNSFNAFQTYMNHGVAKQERVRLLQTTLNREDGCYQSHFKFEVKLG